MKTNKESYKNEISELDYADFVITQEKYEKFLAILDEAPKSIPALRRLFCEESVIDDLKQSQLILNSNFAGNK